MFPQNVGLSSNYMALKPGGPYSSQSSLLEPQIELSIYNWWMRSLTYVTSASCSLWGKSHCPHERKTWTSTLNLVQDFGVWRIVWVIHWLMTSYWETYVVIVISSHHDACNSVVTWISGRVAQYILSLFIIIVLRWACDFVHARLWIWKLSLLGGSDAGCHFV
jgi:hypothetical protein